MKKNKNLIVTIVVIIIAVIVVMVVIKNNNNKVIEPVVETEPTMVDKNIDLNQAIISDTTTSITESLDKIDFTDTSADDLKEVDQELQNL